MNAEIEEYFYLLREVCRADDSSLGTAYRQLRELLEHLCRTQMTDSSLQMTDLAARINFVSSKLGLTVAEQNRLHTFRLASNAVLNRQAEPSREKLLRDGIAHDWRDILLRQLLQRLCLLYRYEIWEEYHLNNFEYSYYLHYHINYHLLYEVICYFFYYLHL